MTRRMPPAVRTKDFDGCLLMCAVGAARCTFVYFSRQRIEIDDCNNTSLYSFFVVYRERRSKGLLRRHETRTLRMFMRREGGAMTWRTNRNNKYIPAREGTDRSPTRRGRYILKGGHPLVFLLPCDLCFLCFAQGPHAFEAVPAKDLHGFDVLAVKGG